MAKIKSFNISQDGFITKNCNGFTEKSSIKIEPNKKSKIYYNDIGFDHTIIDSLEYGNRKNFTIGYFPILLNSINQYVKKNESYAICFISKQEIFRFMKYLDIYSKFKHKQDYAIVCSPNRLADKNYYEKFSKKAIKSYSKNADHEKPFKFILCTSYIEMGVDFSVQRLSLEVSPLYNVIQQLGRLDRWNIFGENCSCEIFPLYSYTEEDLGLIESKFNKLSIYKNINSYYKNKNGKCISSFYTQQELDEHYSLFKGNNFKNWTYINTCGTFRVNYINKNTKDTNGMYRQIEEVPYIDENGNEYNVPSYKINQLNSGELKSHPELGI